MKKVIVYEVYLVVLFIKYVIFMLLMYIYKNSLFEFCNILNYLLFLGMLDLKVNYY